MEIKKYIEKVLNSDNEEKKNQVFNIISYVIKKYNDKDREEIERELYEISEGKVLNEERANYLIEHMKPYGKKWNLDETESVRTQYGYDNIRPVDFWIVMNSAYNDYNDIFKDNVEYYAKFTRDFICDEDAKEDKVYYYYSMIPKDR